MKIWIISSNITEEFKYLSAWLDKIEDKLHIKTELRLITWNRAMDTLIGAFKNNNPPDVLSVGTTWMHTLRFLNYLAPMPDSFPIKPHLADWMMDCITHNGKKYGMPFLSEVYILMAKQKNLDAVGIQPDDLKDWDSLYVSCVKIAEYFHAHGIAEHIPMAFPIRPEIGTLHRFAVWLFKAGWTFPKLYPGMERIFRNDTAIQTLGYISRLLRSSSANLNVLKTDSQSVIDTYLHDKNLFTFYVGNGADYVMDLLNHRKDKDITLYPLPSLVPDGKTFGGGSVLAVSAASRHQELAWRVVEALTQEDVLMGLSGITGNLPMVDSIFWEKYGTDPAIQVLYDQLKKSTAYSFHPLWHTIEQTSGEFIAHYLWECLGEKELELYEAADKTLENLDSRIIDLLNMMWEMQGDENDRE